MLDFDVAFDRLIGHEGGYVDDPDDPGGETQWGITWPILRQAIVLGLVPADTTIRSLTREQSKPIYRALFWERVHAGELHDGVAWQLFDFAINSGIETAVRKLQQAVGVADDGHWGPVSRAAAAAMSESDLILRLVGLRLEYMTRLRNWPAHGRGWARRIARNLRYGAEDSD